MLKLRQEVGGQAGNALLPPDGTSVTFSTPVAFRGEHLFVVSCRKGMTALLALGPGQVRR